MSRIKYYDLHVDFDWKNYEKEKYAAVFKPILLAHESTAYDKERISIAIASEFLPSKYDLANFPSFSFNIELLTRVREKGCAVEFCLRDINEYVQRGRIERIKFFSKIVRSYKIPYVFTSGASTIYEVKSPKEFVFIGELLGFKQKDVLSSMSFTAEKILEGKGWL